MQEALPERSLLPYGKIVQRFVVGEDLARAGLKSIGKGRHLRRCDALGRWDTGAGAPLHCLSVPLIDHALKAANGLLFLDFPWSQHIRLMAEFK